jgi:hypothetical protein
MSSRRWQLLVALLIPLAHAEETTTENLINDYGWTPSGGILNHYNHHHTDYTGGSVSQIIDISAYEGQTSYNYNTDVTACENRIGGHCDSGLLDTFTVTLTLDTGEQWINTYSVGNQWEEIDITYTPTADASTATLELYGADNGYWAGWYGPVFYSGSFTVTFDPTLTEVIIPAANPELSTALPADPVNDPSMGLPTIDTTPVSIPTVDVAAAEVSMPIRSESQQAPTTASTQTSSTQQPTQPTGTKTSEAPAPSSSGGSKQNTKVSVRTAAGVVSTSIDAANASSQSIGDAFGDPSNPVAQAVMVAVMASNGANLTEARLIQPELPKPRTIRDKRFEDRFWLDSLRSEARFQKHMVDKQWQK